MLTSKDNKFSGFAIVTKDDEVIRYTGDNTFSNGLLALCSSKKEAEKDLGSVVVHPDCRVCHATVFLNELKQ